ncbi:hypothetical protein HanRHA438_Chr15g0711471 [Helianthus annuus]|nr:hypothetical protein HanRHA438_Chr15g0711471 [Helianthus annuus]
MRVLLFHCGLNLPRVLGTSMGIPFNLHNWYMLLSKLLNLSILDRQRFLNKL